MQQIFSAFLNLIFPKENDGIWHWKEIIPTSIFIALMFITLWLSIKR
jgi:hypothetical protein